MGVSCLPVLRLVFGLFRHMEEHQIVGQSSIPDCHFTVHIDPGVFGQITNTGRRKQRNAVLLQTTVGAFGGIPGKFIILF